jgi:hypothetical protein
VGRYAGLDKVLADIEAFAKEDALFWKPAPLLESWWPRARTSTA